MTYVAQYFHAFSTLDRLETAGRRVGKFAEVMQSVWESECDYEKRVQQVGRVCCAMQHMTDVLSAQLFTLYMRGPVANCRHSFAMQPLELGTI